MTDKTDALVARIRMHASDCVRAADMDTDIVLSPAQVDDMADAFNQAAEALAAPAANVDVEGLRQIAVEVRALATKHDVLIRLERAHQISVKLHDLIDSAGGAKCKHQRTPEQVCDPCGRYPQPAEGDGAVYQWHEFAGRWEDFTKEQFDEVQSSGEIVLGETIITPAMTRKLYTRPAATAVVPDGFVLVPKIMHLDTDTLQAASFIFGGEDGEFSDSVLSVGITTDDDGKETYGLFCYSADYPEEGTIPLFDFAAPAVPKGGVVDEAMVEAVVVEAWTEADMQKPWGAETASLRHLANDPALNREQAMMLRHCAKRIESTAGIHLRALADMLEPANHAGVLRAAADALNPEPQS